MITFNNIVERFKVFAENHFFIETFSFGSPDDVDLSKFTSFPLMHLVYTGATYDAGTKTYNLEVYILDVPGDKTKKVDRQKEVVSDAEQCAEDIIADIKNGGNIFLFAQDYEVVNATTTPLEEETKNVLSGVLLDLSVAIPYEWDACNAPIDGVEPGGTEVTYARRGVLRMLTLDGATDVPSVRTIKVTNGTLTDDGDGVVTLDTGGVDTLAGLTDVDVTGVTDGQVLKYDEDNDEWIPANDQSATSLGNLDDVSITTPADRESLIYDGGNWVNDNLSKSDVGLANVDNTSDADKPVSSATQTALDAKADTSAVPTELNDLSDVTITGTPAGNEALIFDTATSSFKSLPNFTNRFEDDAENNKPATPFVERVYTVKADGDGIFIDAQSDTPSSGKVIVRKIYQKAGFLESGDAIGDFTLIHTFDDDTAYSATESTFEGFRDGDTYGSPPFTLIQTWEEEDEAPAFTGLLNESYGSGAEAAYSTRRLNGNVTDCMVIRRASDSTTTTIGFDSEGNIDESAIETFCSGTTCTVSEWKDQSGNGNDATAAASTNEPTIYTGGAIVRNTFGKPALLAAAGKEFTNIATFEKSTVYAFSVFEAIARRQIFSIGSYLGFENSVWQSTGSVPMHSAYVGNNRFDGISRNDGNSHLFNASGVSSTINLYTDGTLDKTGSRSISGTDTFELLARNSGTAKITENIVYLADKSSDRTSIESNIGDYFTQNTPLLDTYTGAAACYSLRLMRTAYTGDAVEVYNGSSYADIGFNVFGELDTVALADHCGSNDGFVSKWYDQSGNSNDAAQTTTANMPKIYDGTTGVVTRSGKNAIDFTGAYSLQSSTGSMTQPNTTFSVADFISGKLIDASTGRRNYEVQSGGNIALWAGASPFTATTAGGYSGTSNLQIISTILDGSNTEHKLNNNTAETCAASTNSSTGFHFGGQQGQTNGSMYISEFVAYESDQSANVDGIHTNQNTFYDIYS